MGTPRLVVPVLQRAAHLAGELLVMMQQRAMGVAL